MPSNYRHPTSTLPSQTHPQRYSHASEYIDTRRSYHDDGSRLPLRDTTANTQGHEINSLVSCYETPVNLSPPIQTTNIIPPPIVPSQSFDCIYRIQTTPRQHHHQQQSRFPRRSRNNGNVNPLYAWPAFRQYRHRQAHKDTQKDKGGVWRRPELEDAFVDAVLLMPHMGRRKFSMNGKLYGRNMLISEYIFVICVAVLGSKEIFRIDNSNDSIEQMGRKQVSSHMQVVKKFFEDLRCFHFLFPAEEKKEPGTTNSDDCYEEEEQESFKSNPVLTALAENRIPDVKPNYEYFSQLLALQSSISIRPKTCEIFVSSPNVTIRDDVAYDTKNDQPLDSESFPHLQKYINCDDRPNVLGKDILLHEYTRSLDRTTSACAKTVTRRWEKDAPAMYESLNLPTYDEECLLIEMCSTVDLHEHAKFPSGSELTGFVEVAIAQPGLQNHRWKCVTKLTRPSELHTEENRPEVYTNESGIHRRGCSDSKPDCDCHMRSRQEIHVPFPAVEWASILSMAVQYPDVEHQHKKNQRNSSNKKTDKPLERAGSKRKRSEDEGDVAAWTRRDPTGSDLICKVAMYQELWSCAPDSNRWTRHAIIFWRFSTTNQWYKYNTVFRPAGTTWRWLTVNDPMSRYHQQKALVYPSAASINRDAVMSPTPSVSQHLTAAMSEQFGQAWDGKLSTQSGLPLPPPATTAAATTGPGMNMFETFSSGLATPPPSASLHGSYPASGSFDGSNNFLSSSCPDGQTSTMPSQGHHAYSFDAAGHAVTTYADVKPLTATTVNHYMPPMTDSLDLSGSLGYDSSNTVTTTATTTTTAGGTHGQHSSLQGWDMTALDGWTSGPSTQQPGATGHGSIKMDAPNLWQPVHWGQPPLPMVVGGREESKRPVKRRRGDGLVEHVPVTGGW